MSELSAHARGPYWVEELPRSDEALDRIPTARKARLFAAHEQETPGHEQRHPLDCLAHQRQHAAAPVHRRAAVRVFNRCVA